MSFLIPHYYRRRFNPEITLEDITNAKLHLEPIRAQLRDVDNTLRAIISRVSRTYNIPIPGGAMGLSTMTSPTSPTGDLTRDSARLLLLYLRAVLSKGYFREVDRTWEKVDRFEKSYWDEDEGEATNTGFWKRLELGDEVLEEGVTCVKKWRDGGAREKEWWPKIRELEDAIREGKRWEQDVGLRRSSVGSAASSSASGLSNVTASSSSTQPSSVSSYQSHQQELRGSMRMSMAMAGFKPFALGGGIAAAAGAGMNSPTHPPPMRSSVASFGTAAPGSRAGSVSGMSETAESVIEEPHAGGGVSLGGGIVGGDTERIRERWRRRQYMSSHVGDGGEKPERRTGEYMSMHMANANANLGGGVGVGVRGSE
ncbi:hypothetical protein DFH27DRAFT_526144 [Peziza echinospora]|nr:hypothetical protein DFH27DRAFT_526144 [Peziza echinospora]